MCVHINRDDFLAAYGHGLQVGLQSMAQMDWAMTVARNGGNELLLRTLVSSYIEGATFVTTEGNGRRVDVVHSCAMCGAVVGAVEFKHNFLSQYNDIARAMISAPMQLLAVQASDVARVCVFLTFGLIDNGPFELQDRHNEAVVGYKRFKPIETVEAHLGEAMALLGEGPFGPYEITQEGRPWTAQLHAWAFGMSEDNQLFPIAHSE